MLSLPTLSALVLLALALALVAANGFVDENPTDSDFASSGIGRKLMQLNVGGGDEDEDGEGSRGLQQRRGPETFFNKDFFLKVDTGIVLTIFNPEGTR